MSDEVILVVAVLIFLAVLATYLARGKLKVLFKDVGVIAESANPEQASMKMEASGKGSEIRHAKQIREGAGGRALEMTARDGASLAEVEQREKSSD